MSEQTTKAIEFRAGAWYKSVTGWTHVAASDERGYELRYFKSPCGVLFRPVAGPFILAGVEDWLRCPRCLKRAEREAAVRAAEDAGAGRG